MAPISTTIEFFASGYCEAHANVVNPISGKGKAKFYAVWALISIPEIGYIMFDTGYSKHFQEVTNSFPARFYRWATPVFLKENDSAREILKQKGIRCDEIKYIIISHFHADHIAGLRDFDKATFICAQSSLEEVKNLSGFKAVSKGILHGLLPNNFYERVTTIEQLANSIEIDVFGITHYHLFNNQYFELILVPGHAKGMLGFIFKKEDQHLVFATDAAWSTETFEKEILPKKIVKLFFDSWSDFVDTQSKLRAYKKQNPNCNILFTHCPYTLNFISNEI